MKNNTIKNKDFDYKLKKGIEMPSMINKDTLKREFLKN